jgi:hypothetical protein
VQNTLSSGNGKLKEMQGKNEENKSDAVGRKQGEDERIEGEIIKAGVGETMKENVGFL